MVTPIGRSRPTNIRPFRVTIHVGGFHEFRTTTHLATIGCGTYTYFMRFSTRMTLPVLFLVLSLVVPAASTERGRSTAAEAVGLEIAEDGTVSASFDRADLRLVLRAFAEVGGFQLVLDEEVRGKVTAEFDGVPLARALTAILRTHGLSAEVDGRRWADGTPSATRHERQRSTGPRRPPWRRMIVREHPESHFETDRPTVGLFS